MATPPLAPSPPVTIRLRVAHKLALIVIALLVPVGVLTYLLTATYNEQLQFDHQEVDGLNYLRPLRKLTQHLQDHRSISYAVLSGDGAAKAALVLKEAQIEEDLKAVEQAERQTSPALRAARKWKSMTERLAKVKGQWADLKSKGGKLSPPDSLKEHGQLLEMVGLLVGDVGEASNLILDPALDSYWTQDVLTVRNLELTDLLDQLRSTGVGIAVRKTRSPEDEADLLKLLGKVALARDEMATDCQSVMDNNETVKARISEPYKSYNDALDGFVAAVNDQLLKPTKVNVAPAEFMQAGDLALERSYKLADDIDPVLLDMLNDRITTLNRNSYIAYASLAGGLLLTLGMVYLISRGITKQVGEIRSMFAKIAEGDFTARARVVTRDELGQMARAVNEEVLPLVQSHEDRERLQDSITKLLEEVSGVAEGDLTREAVVSADATGAIADSFNYMTDQLRKIISNVQTSTHQVSTSANRIFATTDVLAKGSEAQAQQIVATSAAVDEMAASIQQVSTDAATSSVVAQQALLSARKGNEAVKTTIRGMNRIRKQVQETAKRIKRLGESSQEIGQIIQLINEISERTSILALNASIQASMAGEAGRGFAVVAEEVERLAVRSSDATRKIGSLVKTIQTETGEAVTAMEKGIGQVVEGSQLANQAGQALVEIETVSNRLAELINSISQASKQQAQGSEAVAKSMAQIAQFTRRTVAGTREAAGAVSTLTSLAATLRASVSTFRLPASQTTFPEPVAPAGLGNGMTPSPSRAGVAEPETVEMGV
jgi:twitching motility protein PilJ